MYFFQPFCSEDDDVSNWSHIIIKYPYLQQMISIQMGVSKKNSIQIAAPSQVITVNLIFIILALVL